MLHFGGAEVARVDLYEGLFRRRVDALLINTFTFPAEVDADMMEGQGAELAHRVVLARGDDEVLGLLLLQDEPHALRDWGYAKDYVECMWLILQNKEPEDFVIATGVQHSVREFTQLAFHHAGIDLKFEGKGLDEKGIVVKGPEKLIGKTVVAVSEDFYRPTDVVNLLGDPSKARRELGWNPQSTSFEQLVSIMVKHDMQKVAADHVAGVMRTNLAEYLEKGITK